MEGMGNEGGNGISKSAMGSALQASGSGQDFLKAGSYVERGTPLATLNDLDIVAASLALPIDLAAMFNQGDSLHLSIPSAGFSAMARIDYLESIVTDTNRTLTAKAYVPNPGWKLKAGSLGQAHLTPDLDSVWALPRTAVRNQGEKWMVWARSTTDTAVYQAREVRLGRRGRRFVEIIRGVAPGESVAENPSLLVDPDAIAESLRLQDSTPNGGLPSRPESHSRTSDHSVNDSHGASVPAKEHGEHAGHGSDDSHSASRPHSNPKSALRITSEQELLAGIRTEKATIAMLSPSDIFRATTRFDGRSSESVPTRVEGTVERVRFRRPGEKVLKGQILADIRSDALLAAQQEYLLAASQSRTLPDQAMARSQTLAARRRLMVLGMNASRIEALARSGKTSGLHSIASPISGVILAVDVHPGQFVTEGTSLFLVGGGDRIWVETWMLPEESATYPEGSEAWVEIDGLPGEPKRGLLEHAGQGAVVSGALAIAHVGIPNPEGKILPGLQAWVTLKGKGRQTLAIPPSALLESSKSIMAWLRISPNKYAPRMVMVGLRTPTAVEILDGIQSGEDVVIAGASLLNGELIIREGGVKGHGGH